MNDEQRISELANVLFSKGLAASLWDAKNKARDILGFSTEMIRKSADDLEKNRHDESPIHDILSGAGIDVVEVKKAEERKIEEVKKEFQQSLEQEKEKEIIFESDSGDKDINEEVSPAEEQAAPEEPHVYIEEANDSGRGNYEDTAEAVGDTEVHFEHQEGQETESFDSSFQPEKHVSQEGETFDMSETHSVSEHAQKANLFDMSEHAQNISPAVLDKTQEDKSELSAEMFDNAVEGASPDMTVNEAATPGGVAGIDASAMESEAHNSSEESTLADDIPDIPDSDTMGLPQNDIDAPDAAPEEIKIGDSQAVNGDDMDDMEEAGQETEENQSSESETDESSEQGFGYNSGEDEAETGQEGEKETPDENVDDSSYIYFGNSDNAPIDKKPKKSESIFSDVDRGDIGEDHG